MINQQRPGILSLRIITPPKIRMMKTTMLLYHSLLSFTTFSSGWISNSKGHNKHFARLTTQLPPSCHHHLLPHLGKPNWSR
jgi:hypothetical protein